MRAWLARLFGAPATPLRGVRWVVIDCETSGLDPARDQLLSVGAVALREGRIGAAESFAATLRQDAASAPDNILVHGIGADAQLAGRAPREALGEFAAFVGDGVPVAFHAPFDAAVLGRAMAGMAGLPALGKWIDLARLAPVLHPSLKARGRALDDWIEAFGIRADGRHNALHDAFATAQLLQVLLAEAERQGSRSVADLRRLERAGRWTGG